jgi:AbrB family looped-hinge helix DNA binding protein
MVPERFNPRGDRMAIFRTRYYGDVTVGVGGRITIPQDMRDDLGIHEGDLLTVRVEENSNGVRQLVIWRAEQPSEE